jgi:very-short-patch-repair endonuclease
MGVQNPPRDGEGDRAKRGGGGSPSLRRPEVYEARKARREMSLPEVLLWQRLKGSPQGIAFRKQHPIGTYRADFYCAAAKLVIEVDGIAHEMGDRPQRDAERTAWLEEQGYQIIRIPAADVLRNANDAAQSIVSFAASPLHRPADGPPPLPGEDLP